MLSVPFLASARELSDASLRALADVLRRHPIFTSAYPVGDRCLAETFEIWTLGPLDQAVDANGRLVARDTGYLHHQIRTGAKARDYARSQLNGDAQSIVLHQLAASSLSGKLDTVVKWVDDRTDTEGEIARLLTIPSRFIDAIWLYSRDQDRIALVHKLPNRTGPAYKHLYNPKAFVAAALRAPRSHYRAPR